MPTLLAVLFTTSCQVDRLEVPADELYTREFIKEFGVCDPNQDWNAATSVTAQVDASSIPSTATVYIYDRMPGADGCQLAAQFSAKTGNFSFDFAKHNTRAYVQVTDQNGTTLLSSYLPITSSTLTISPRPASRAAETMPIYANKLGNDKLNGLFRFNTGFNWSMWKNDNTINLLKNGVADPGMNGDATTDLWRGVNMYVLSEKQYDTSFAGAIKGTWSSNDDSRRMSDLTTLVGKAGKFHEGAENNICNLIQYKSDLNPQNGVTFISEGGSEIELEYFFGAGYNRNSFGYFYFEEGASVTDIIKAPKFLLMYDASTWENLMIDNERFFSGTPSITNTETYLGASEGNAPADAMEIYESNQIESNNKSLRPSHHKLLYFDIDENHNPIGTGKTIWPKKKLYIGFFIIPNGASKLEHPNDSWKIDGTSISYSLPWMNQLYGHVEKDRHNTTYNFGNASHPSYINFQNEALNWDDLNSNLKGDHPYMSFVTYLWNGNLVLATEDGNNGGTIDHDMNDILFFVRGIKPEDIYNFETYPYAQSWVIACEDLGSTYDFDFNDMVFGVSYVATDETNRKVYIKALAAGGTMPIELYRNGVKLGEKEHWNHWFGESDHSVVINASGSGVKEGDEFEITLGEDEEFSLTSALFRPGVDENAKAMGGFSVQVNGKTWVKPVGAEGYAPQMMLLPVGWSWPTEHTPIYEAYPGNGADIPGFRDWYHSGDYTIWNKLTPADGKVFKHNWKGHPIENK